MPDRPHRPESASDAAGWRGSAAPPWAGRWCRRCRAPWPPPDVTAHDPRRMAPTGDHARSPGRRPSSSPRPEAPLPAAARSEAGLAAPVSTPGVATPPRSAPPGQWPDSPTGCNAALPPERTPPARHRQLRPASAPDQPPASGGCSRRTAPPPRRLPDPAPGKQQPPWRCTEPVPRS